MGEGERGQQQAISGGQGDIIWRGDYLGIVYTYTGCGVEYQLFGDCTYCSVHGVWTSTIWGFYTGLLGDCTGCRAHHWLGVKKNILAERRGNLLGNICKEYDITATKHRPVSYEERTIGSRTAGVKLISRTLVIRRIYCLRIGEGAFARQHLQVLLYFCHQACS